MPSNALQIWYVFFGSFASKIRKRVKSNTQLNSDAWMKQQLESKPIADVSVALFQPTAEHNLFEQTSARSN